MQTISNNFSRIWSAALPGSVPGCGFPFWEIKNKRKKGDFMKKWLLTCSIDAVCVDFETVLSSEEEPGFWTCDEIAQANGCDFWTICEL